MPKVTVDPSMHAAVTGAGTDLDSMVPQYLMVDCHRDRHAAEHTGTDDGVYDHHEQVPFCEN